MKKVLMIAYHFPPFQGSSGVHRTARFAQYLPENGFEPIVLTPHPRAYGSAGPTTADNGLQDVAVHPAFCIDTARHLAVQGKYLGWMALPDRWISWWLGAVPLGLRLIRSLRPVFIYSTYPIATAHLIALTLRRVTRVCWIADMRDPMIDAVHPSNRLVRRAHACIESRTVAYATKVICTTPGAAAHYRLKYPAVPPSRFAVIENGYDEESF